MWCIGFQKLRGQGITILGGMSVSFFYNINVEMIFSILLTSVRIILVTNVADLVLKDRIVVYDLGGQRIGWANYDCKLSSSVPL